MDVKHVRVPLQPHILIPTKMIISPMGDLSRCGWCYSCSSIFFVSLCWIILLLSLPVCICSQSELDTPAESTGVSGACPYWHQCQRVIRHSERSYLNATKVVGLHAKRTAGALEFRIETFHENGTRNPYGGDSFWVRAEGISILHGTVTDHWNGTYTVTLPLYDVGTFKIHVRRDYSRCEGTAVCKLHNLTLENAPVPGSPFHIFVEKSVVLWKKGDGNGEFPMERWLLPEVFLNAKLRNEDELGVSEKEFQKIYAKDIYFIKAMRKSAYYDVRGMYVPYDGDRKKVLFEPEQLRDKWFHFIGDSVSSHIFRTLTNTVLSGYEVQVSCLEERQRHLCFSAFNTESLFRSRFQYRAFDGCLRPGVGSWCSKALLPENLYFVAKSCADLEREYTSHERGRRCLAPGELSLFYFPSLNLTLSRRYTDVHNMKFVELKQKGESAEYCSYSRKVTNSERIFSERCAASEMSISAHPFYTGVQWCHDGAASFSEVSEALHLISPWVLRSSPGRTKAFPDAFYFNYGLHHTAFSCANIDAYEYAVRAVVDEIRSTTGSSIVFGATTPPQFHMGLFDEDLIFVHELDVHSRCNTPYRTKCLNDVLRRIAEEEIQRGRSAGRTHAYVDTFSIADPRVDSPLSNVHYERGSVYSAIATAVLRELVRLDPNV